MCWSRRCYVAARCEYGLLQRPCRNPDNGKYGELVPVGDAGKLADAICRALDAPRDKDFLRSRGGEFSIEKAVENYRRILLEDCPAMMHSNTCR
jgi:hypothetical protein